MASVGSVIQKHGFSYQSYADDTQLYLSFHPDDLKISARISVCLTDISCYTNDHHLQFNFAKTELLVVPINPSLHHNFSIQLGTSTITPKTARNIEDMIDDQLTFSDHITKTTRSCRFALLAICSHKIQDTNVCLQNHPWLCTPLPKFTTSDLCCYALLCHPKEGPLSQTLTLTVPSWLNDLSNSIRAAAIFKKRLKTHFFQLYLTL